MDAANHRGSEHCYTERWGLVTNTYKIACGPDSLCELCSASAPDTDLVPLPKTQHLRMQGRYTEVAAPLFIIRGDQLSLSSTQVSYSLVPFSTWPL